MNLTFLIIFCVILIIFCVLDLILKYDYFNYIIIGMLSICILYSGYELYRLYNSTKTAKGEFQNATWGDFINENEKYIQTLKAILDKCDSKNSADCQVLKKDIQIREQAINEKKKELEDSMKKKKPNWLQNIFSKFKKDKTNNLQTSNDPQAYGNFPPTSAYGEF